MILVPQSSSTMYWKLDSNPCHFTEFDQIYITFLSIPSLQYIYLPLIINFGFYTVYRIACISTMLYLFFYICFYLQICVYHFSDHYKFQIKAFRFWLIESVSDFYYSIPYIPAQFPGVTFSLCFPLGSEFPITFTSLYFVFFPLRLSSKLIKRASL